MSSAFLVFSRLIGFLSTVVNAKRSILYIMKIHPIQ